MVSNCLAYLYRITNNKAFTHTESYFLISILAVTSTLILLVFAIYNLKGIPPNETL